MTLSILYRGPLASCNYACRYCPFAKRRDSRSLLKRDRNALEKFVGWVETHAESELRILFTPWGEALVRPWYREALARLTRLDHVAAAGAQTNLSCRLDWLARCRAERLFLWCSWHPSEAVMESFVGKCLELDRAGVRHCAGVVGVPEYLEVFRALRKALPPGTYLWINAMDGVRRQYSKELIREFTGIDPHFAWTLRPHASFGRKCHAGERSVTVDGEGDIRRCHFVEEPIGNLYRTGLLDALEPRTCPRASCRCHIGYVNLPGLRLQETFSGGVLERIPAGWPPVAAVPGASGTA